jgi:hypothetical protein
LLIIAGGGTRYGPTKVSFDVWSSYATAEFQNANVNTITLKLKEHFLFYNQLQFFLLHTYYCTYSFMIDLKINKLNTLFFNVEYDTLRLVLIIVTHTWRINAVLKLQN